MMPGNRGTPGERIGKQKMRYPRLSRGEPVQRLQKRVVSTRWYRARQLRENAGPLLRAAHRGGWQL